MSFKHNSFLNSPVMEELEKIAMKKGMVKKQELKKEASKQETYSPTDDLVYDITRLANGLREKGFNKQAEQLEQKLLEFKVAETHLYRAIDEDGDDFINSAHPEGEVKISDAKEGHGIIETQVTQHKKILDVVKKNPKGKYAKVVDELIVSTADILEVDLKKKAQTTDKNSIIKLYGVYRTRLINTVDAAKKSKFVLSPKLNRLFFVARAAELSDLSKAILGHLSLIPLEGLRQLTYPTRVLASSGPYPLGNSVASTGSLDRYFLDFYINANKFPNKAIEDFENIEGGFDELFTPEATENAQNALAEELELIKNLFSRLPTIEQLQEISAYSYSGLAEEIKDIYAKSGLLRNILAYDEDQISAFKKLTSSIANSFKSLDRQEGRAEQHQQAPQISDAVSADKIRSIESRLGSLVKSYSGTKYYDGFNKLWKVWQRHVGRAEPLAYSAILQQMVDSGDHNISKQAPTLEAFDNLLQKYEQYLKRADTSIGIEKKALEELPDRPATHPVAGNVKKPVLQVKEPEKSHVVNMQDFLNNLSMQLRLALRNKSFIEKHFSNTDVEYLNKLALNISKTGVVEKETSDRPDGVWGRNTARALRSLSLLVKASKYSTDMSGAISFGPIYRSNKTSNEAIAGAKLADSNTNYIYEFGKLLGLTVSPEKEDTKVTDFYDKIDRETRNLSDSSWVNPARFFNDGLALTDKDLKSFSDLENFLDLNNFVTGQLKKEFGGAKHYSLDSWKEIIGAFLKRARAQLDYFTTASPNPDNAKRKEQYIGRLSLLNESLQKLIDKYGNSVIPASNMDSAVGLQSKIEKPTAKPVPGKQTAPAAPGQEGYEFAETKIPAQLIQLPFTSEMIDLRFIEKVYPDIINTKVPILEAFGHLPSKILYRSTFEDTRPNIVANEVISSQGYTWPEIFKNVYPGSSFAPYSQLPPGHPIRIRTESWFASSLLVTFIDNLLSLIRLVYNEYEARKEDPQYGQYIPDKLLQQLNRAYREWVETLTVMRGRAVRNAQQTGSGEFK